MSFPSSIINYVLIFYQVSNFTFLFYFIPGLDKKNGACLVVWFVGLAKGLQTTNQIYVSLGLAIRDQCSDRHRKINLATGHRPTSTLHCSLLRAVASCFYGQLEFGSPNTGQYYTSVLRTSCVFDSSNINSRHTCLDGIIVLFSPLEWKSDCCITLIVHVISYTMARNWPFLSIRWWRGWWKWWWCPHTSSY
jgi:hypothetical protein